MNELDALRQEAETLKNAIRVSKFFLFFKFDQYYSHCKVLIHLETKFRILKMSISRKKEKNYIHIRMFLFIIE